MSEEVIILKDLKLVPDKYYEYTPALRNSRTPIIIDNGNYIMCGIIHIFTKINIC